MTTTPIGSPRTPVAGSAPSTPTAAAGAQQGLQTPPAGAQQGFQTPSHPAVAGSPVAPNAPCIQFNKHYLLLAHLYLLN